MSLSMTLILLVATLAFAAFCGWRGARPPDIVKGPRMIPWRFLMVLSATLIILLLVHIAWGLRGTSPMG